MKQNPDRVYVHPEFKKLLKLEAARTGKSIMQFTQELTKKSNFENIVTDIKKQFEEKKSRRLHYDFP